MTLAAYATLAAAILPNTAHTNIIYTDIDPDILVNEPGTGVSLDLDGDGTNDFDFFFSSANSAVFTYFGGINWYIINGIFAAPKNDNAIAAFTGSSGAYAYPYAIGSGIEIGPYAGQFLTNPYQTLAYQFYAIINSYLYYPIFIAGDWVFGQEDKYVGLQLAVGDSTYYGWIRLTTDPSNRAFTVKDFAWEDKANTAIETGFGPMDVETPTAPEANIYAQLNTVYIDLNGPVFPDAVVKIFDLQGNLIIERRITQSNFNMALDIPSGIYIVTILQHGDKQSRKLFISGT